MRRCTPILLVALLLGSCSFSRAPKDEFLAGTADTAYAVKVGGETVFWDVPRFILWTIPKAILYDLPASVVSALQGNRAHVEALVARLSAEDTTVEQEVAISEQLRELTGIPIQSAARWRLWWQESRSRPEGEWRRAWVEAALDGLTAPGYFDRAAAIEDLRLLYGDTLGYDPKGPPDSIAAAAGRWRARYEKEGIPHARH